MRVFHLFSLLPLVDFFGHMLVTCCSAALQWILFLCFGAFCRTFCLLSCSSVSLSLHPSLSFFHTSSLNSLHVSVRLLNSLFSSLLCLHPAPRTYSPPGPLFWQSTLHRLENSYIFSISLSDAERVAEFKESPIQQHTSPIEPALLQRIASQTPTQPEASSVEPVSHAASELPVNRTTVEMESGQVLRRNAQHSKTRRLS